jgi:hypothetical protein
MMRGEEYEIFSHNGVTSCYDDPSLDRFSTPQEMFTWIREQDPRLWHGLKNWPNEDCAYYLKPELYLLWKLKWA